MKVQDIMSHTIHTCRMESTLQEVAMSMWDNDCGCLPVVDDQHKAIAMITDRDIAMGAALQHKLLAHMKVSDITQGHVLYSCSANEDIHSALHTMQQYGVRRLPVMHHDKLVGLISMGDILAKADSKSKADLPIKDAIAFLKTVTGHHGEIMQMN